MPLFPRRSVRDEAHRIEGFPRATGADDHPGTVQVALRGAAQSFEDTLDDDARVGQPPLARVAARKPPALGRDDLDAPALEGGQVVPNRGVLPHLGVHGRAQDHRRPRRQQRGTQEIVGEPGGVAGDGVRGGRHDHDQIGGLAEPRVGNG